jgi:hypothetical protein
MRAALLNTPRSQEEWLRWSFHHRGSHDLIRSTIRQQNSVNLSDYIIDPISFQQPHGWLENNTQLHTDMNGVLGKPGVDLEDLDFQNDHQLRAWIYLHYQEHLTAETTLGICS